MGKEPTTTLDAFVAAKLADAAHPKGTQQSKILRDVLLSATCSGSLVSGNKGEPWAEDFQATADRVKQRSSAPLVDRGENESAQHADMLAMHMVNWAKRLSDPNDHSTERAEIAALVERLWNVANNSLAMLVSALDAHAIVNGELTGEEEDAAKQFIAAVAVSEPKARNIAPGEVIPLLRAWKNKTPGRKNTSKYKLLSTLAGKIGVTIPDEIDSLSSTARKVVRDKPFLTVKKPT